MTWKCQSEACLTYFPIHQTIDCLDQLFKTINQNKKYLSRWIFLCNEKTINKTIIHWIDSSKRCFSLCSTFSTMAEHPITFWQRISQEMSMFFRRLTQCLSNCFQPPDEDQLLRDGPSQSPSLENNFNASTVSMQRKKIQRFIFFHRCGCKMNFGF